MKVSEKDLSVIIASIGRFHVADLAREFDKLGIKVRFISDVPGWRLARFGLRPDLCKTLWPVTIFTLIQRAAAKLRSKKLMEWSGWFKQSLFDFLVARNLTKATHLISMSGLTNSASQVAKKKYGTRYWVERGNQHILAQKAILQEISPGSKNPVGDFDERMELACYELADKILSPTEICRQSFLTRGFSPDKILQNHYGVDLTDFPVTPPPQLKQPTFAIAGAWSDRKGRDILEKCIAKYPQYQFRHAGNVLNGPLPTNSNFRSLGFLDQKELYKFYGDATALLLPSYEEGFAIVIFQAVACGLPVICSDRSGGQDFLIYPSIKPRMFVFESGNLEQLYAILDKPEELVKIRNDQKNMDDVRSKITWTRYARQYADFLLEDLAREKKESKVNQG